jgi:hypothetical protein
MFIKYNPKDKHIKCIPLVSTDKDAVSLAGDSLMLRPGTNEITEAEWKAIQPHIKAEIESKEIEAFSVPLKEGKGKGGKAKTLKDVPASVAKKIIGGCENPATLKKWFGEDLPDEILLMVTKRLRQLKIDPDEITGGEDGEQTLDDDITPEDGEDEEESGEDTGEDEDTGSDETGEEDKVPEEDGEDEEIPDLNEEA